MYDKYNTKGPVCIIRTFTFDTSSTFMYFYLNKMLTVVVDCRNIIEYFLIVLLELFLPPQTYFTVI